MCGRRANKVLNLIKSNGGNQINTCHTPRLYKSMVLPILSYGSPAWSPSKGDLKTIEQVQRRATKWILGYSDLAYADRLQALNILPLSLNLQIYDILTFVKLLNDDSNFPWFNFVHRNRNTENSNHPTRSAARNDFILPTINKEIQRQNFWYRAPRLYNILARHIPLEGSSAKSRILKFFWDYYNSSYSELDMCTWTFACLCCACRLRIP